MQRGYQYDYSATVTSLYDIENRERKARTILAVLEDHFGDRLSGCSALDVGASTGIIDHYLARSLGRITGIDIDERAITFARGAFQRENLDFRIGDALDLQFPPGSFDIVICTHVYEHVPDARLLLREILRVLRPGGVCYFSAGNRLAWREPHYNLPLLSVLPRFIAHQYLRLLSRGHCYYERHLTLPGLARLTAGFIRHDYTRKIIMQPERYHADYMIGLQGAKTALARMIARYAYFLCPGYIWLLEKPSPLDN